MPQIRFVVALPSEAKPINHHFGLVRDNNAIGFSLYRNQGVALVISGVGAMLSGQATAWLRQQLPEPALWINAGIAGHAHLPVGQGLLASRITDKTSGRAWLTHLPAATPCATGPLITCAEPETEYAESALYDMEAAGFYAAASAAAPAHRILCFKIVSDNPQSPVHDVNRELITRLMTAHLAVIERLADSVGKPLPEAGA